MIDYIHILGICMNYINILYSWCRRASHPTVSEYLLSFDNTEFDRTMTRVPEDCVYVQRWIDETGAKKAWVLYEGEEIIPRTYPFDLRTKAHVPWIWIGDVQKEIDLTEPLAPFMLPGNRIDYDLLVHLIQFDETTKIQYIDKETLNFIDFPEHAIVIDEESI